MVRANAIWVALSGSRCVMGFAALFRALIIFCYLAS